jgi:hypothetical protein
MITGIIIDKALFPTIKLAKTGTYSISLKKIIFLASIIKPKTPG